MERNFDFKDLFILDMANNHQGDVAHGVRIIAEMGDVIKRHNVRGFIKFQFRQLDSFIHPDHAVGSDNKHIPRFMSTRLNLDDYRRLMAQIKQSNMSAICTPFDEESVTAIVDMGFDLLKVASCSAQDWPLLEKVAAANLPVIFSTGGLQLPEIDDLVSFFEHRGVDFAIMHCVSIYPTPDHQCELNQIEILRSRYPNRVIGWSTHEAPGALAPVQVAYAKGARMFERHVGIATDDIILNSYSSGPKEIDSWLTAHKQAVELCGAPTRPPVSKEEAASIVGLRRGVYAKNAIKLGQRVGREDVFFAMPCSDGQMHSGQWQDDVFAAANFKGGEPLTLANVNLNEKSDIQIIKSAFHQVKAMLNEAKISLNSDFVVEVSHHAGIYSFSKTGVVIVNCINRAYCKKIIVQLPGQTHPAHFHKRKEETFQVLSGEVNVTLDGHQRTLRSGETCLIQPGVWHSFWTSTGCIVEEISTTHFNDDSFYADKSINDMDRSQRKTVLDNWGRFQA